MAIVSMMLGVAPVFTGCVDTDEPAGITELRGAKAELLRAKAAVEQARVALVQAKADLKAAEAESERANAEWISQMARKQEIENDFAQAKNELELQELQAKLDSVQTSLAYWKEEAALRHEAKMAKLEQAAAEAQYAYEVALKEIEVAKALGVHQDEVSLTALQTAIEDAYKELYGTDGVAEELRNANKKLYDAQLNKDAGIITDKNGEHFIATLEAEIAVAQAELASEEQALADLQELAKLDIEGTDWVAEINQLKEEVAQLKIQLQEKQAEKSRLQAEPEYLAKYQAVHGLYSAYKEDNPLEKTDDAELLKKGTEQVLDEAEAALKKAANEDKASFSIADYKSSKEVTELIVEAVGDNDKDGVNDLTEGTIEIKGAKDFLWGNDGVATKVPAEAQTIYDKYQNYLDLLKSAEIDENEVAQAEAELKGKQEAEAKAKKAYEEAYADWEEVKDIIAEGKTIQVDVTGFKKVTDAYNTAYAALETAVDNWNEGLQKVYDEAYSNAESKKLLDLKITALGGNGTAISQIASIEGFDEAKVIESWNVYAGTDNQTEAYLTSLIAMNCSDTEDATKAEVQKAVEDALAAYVRQEQNSMDWNDDDFKAAGNAAAAAFGTTTSGKALQTALNKAEEAVEKAYDKLPAAITAFEALSVTFAQANDEKALDINYLTNALDKDGKPVQNLGAWVADATGTGSMVGTVAKKVVGNSEITTDEFTAATTTKFSQTLAQKALDTVSQAAFGEDNRYAPVDIDEAKGGAAKAYQAAIDDTQKTEAKIAAQEDLKLLINELETTLAAAKTSLTTQYKEVFADELTAKAEATEAHKTAQAAFDEADAQFKDLNEEIGKLSAQVAGKNSVSTTLEGFVNAYLQENDVDFTYDPDTFEAEMATAIANKQKEVAAAKEELAKAQVELQKAQDGKYDEVDYWTWKVSIIQEEYNRAMEDYTKAQEDLAKYMEIMAGGTTDAE